MEREIDGFVMFLATERGLSEAYQLSVRQTLDALAGWVAKRKSSLEELGTDELSLFLRERKSEGLSASSLRISMVHLKVFFRWLAGKNRLPMDPAEPLLSPRPDKGLPETMNRETVERLLEGIDSSQP